MIRFLVLFYRSIRNNYRMFLINILGFSIGIVSAMFIYVFVVKEYKTDRFHQKHNDIYRVIQKWNGTDFNSSRTFYPLGNLLQKNFSEIRNFTRYQESSYYQVDIENEKFNNQKLTFVDSPFFEMFDFKLIAGNVDELFANPDKVFITLDIAKKYFKTTDVLGKTIDIIDPTTQEKKAYTISGLLADYPEESTLQPQIIADIKSEERKHSGREWSLLNPQLFLYIPDCEKPENIASKISEVIVNKAGLPNKGGYAIDAEKYKLQKLTDLYLGSNQVNDELAKGDKHLAEILLLVGFVLLIITFVNNIIANLGLSLKNQKNSQINHVLGGGRRWLQQKMVSEGVFYSLIAYVLALVFYPVIYSIIVRVSDYQYRLISVSDFSTLFSFLLILVFIGILSGFIQSIFIRKNFAIKFKGLQFNSQKAVFNKLIQFQLLVFIVASTSLFFIVKQLNHIQNMELGFDIENTFTLSMLDDGDVTLFKEEFEKYPFVKSFSQGEQLYRKDFQSREVKLTETGNIINAQVIQGDADYLETYNIKLLMGSNMDKEKIPVGEEFFNWERKGNTIIDVLVNDEFVKQSGLKYPIGTIVEGGGIMKGRIVGVFNDVKNLPVYQTIKPTVIAYDISGMYMGLAVSIEKGAVGQFKTAAKALYQKKNMDDYFDLLVWEYDFNKEYRKEQVFSKLIVVFTTVILCILLLGLVGLSMFITEIKTKEIGIRKVNGAKISEILTMLNKDFVKWVIIAFVIATPIAYYAMHKWLENFAYKTSLSWWIFALAGLLALGIALLTVSWQSWRAATRNPVEALRYE